MLSGSHFLHKLYEKITLSKSAKATYCGDDDVNLGDWKCFKV
jgi:hypothetical protein